MVTNDTIALERVENNDLYFFGKAILQHNEAHLKHIKDDDLYFLAKNLLNPEGKEIDYIKNDDWYYFGAAIKEKK